MGLGASQENNAQNSVIEFIIKENVLKKLIDQELTTPPTHFVTIFHPATFVFITTEAIRIRKKILFQYFCVM